MELYKRLCKEHKIHPSESVGKQIPNEQLTLPTTREPFNKDTLLGYICNFIIAVQIKAKQLL